MKVRVVYSKFAALLTAVLLGVLAAGCVAAFDEKIIFFSLLGILLVLIVAGLFYGAVYVKADSRYLVLGSVLRGKKIPISQVVSVELFQPIMAAIRICASGGFMGYWGIFRESDIGRYYGFYGKASDCFLVMMQNGDKYVVGCERLQEMVDYIRSQISA